MNSEKTEWAMMKEDVSELRKQIQKYGNKNAIILQEGIDNEKQNDGLLVKKLHFKLGMKSAIEKLIKCKAEIIDVLNDEIKKTSIAITTTNNVYYLLFYSKNRTSMTKVKISKKGKPTIEFSKGDLHRSTNTPEGEKIPASKRGAALSGAYGAKAEKQAQFAKNVLKH